MSSLSDYSIGRKDATIASQSSHNLLTMKPPAPVAAWMEDKRISPLSALEVRQKAKEQLAEEEAIKSGQYKALERERQQATEDAVSAEKACAAIDRLSLIARVPPMLFESSNALIQSLG